MVAGRLVFAPHAAASRFTHHTLVICLLLYGIGMTCDVLDGPVARRTGSSGLGPSLDVVCDATTFGFVPAALLIAITEDSSWHAPVVVGACIYVAATILRLARYAVMESTERQLAHADQRETRRGAFNHDHVVLAAGVLGDGGAWTEACLRQADRVLLVVDDPAAAELSAPLPTPTDVVLLGGGSDARTQALLTTLSPRSTFRVRRGSERSGDVAAIARRLAGRSVGLVLSGGGARGFCHIGVIETLAEAGIRIDRVAGTSIGAFIGALACQGMTPAEIDACCYEEWVRRNPVGDYRVPRVSLLRGERARAMLERTLPGRIEDLSLGFSCVSTDLISARPIRHRLGPLAEAVGASMALPIFVPPVVMQQQLLVDGGLMDNLPTEALARDGEGPIIAVDVSEPSVRALPPGVNPEIPTLPETLFKVMLLSESNDARRRSFADLLIQPDFESIGILEFHMLDRMRAAGRHAATAALADAPASIWG